MLYVAKIPTTVRFGGLKWYFHIYKFTSLVGLIIWFIKDQVNNWISLSDYYIIIF